MRYICPKLRIMGKKTLFIVGLLVACIVASAQMRSVSITPPNATILPGESVTLTATGATFYLWSPATALSTTIGPVTVASPTVTTTYTCTGYEPGPESVVNSNFDQGNVGFTSSYEYNTNLWGEGTYYVDSDASLHHESFVGYGHGDSGNFMIINGATNPGTNVWTEQITVRPNTYYAFSTWVCTVSAGNEAQLQFSINGQQIGNVFTAPTSTNVWQQFYQIWYSGSISSATITILNQNTSGGGNDFGLDDISFCELVYDSEAHCTITVDALTAGDDNASTCQATPVDINVLANDHLIQGCSSPSVTIAQSPSHGTAVLSGNVIRYSPDADFSGNDSFRYRISCSGQNSTATVNVQVFATPNPTIIADPQVAMYGGTVTLTANPNATGTFTYQWSPADKVVDATAATTETVPLFENTNFTVTVTNEQGGCQDSEDIVVAIEGSSMTATASADEYDICQEESTILHARPVGGTGNYSFSWTPAPTLSDASIQDPVATPPLGTTTYSCTISDGYTTQTVSVSITVHPTVYVERQHTLCSNDSIYFYGFGYISEPGIYVHEALTEFGCDSVSSLTLFQNEAYEYSLPDAKICDGSAYHFGGQIITESGYYTYPGTTINGCDSIVHVRVDISDHDEIFYNVNLEEPENTCDSYHWNPQGKEFTGEQTEFLTHSGDYQRVYQNIAGCDSIVNLHVNLDFTPQPSDIFPENLSYVAPHWVVPATEFQVNDYVYKIWETGASVWDSVVWSLDKSNWTLETYGEKGEYCRVYVLENVNDTVWLTANVINRCSSATGIEKKYWLVCSFYAVDESQNTPARVEVFPNPNNGQMTLQMEGLQGRTNVKVFDMQGILVDEFVIQTDGTLATNSYNLPCRSSGIYLFVVTNERGILYKKITVFN